MVTYSVADQQAACVPLLVRSALVALRFVSRGGQESRTKSQRAG
jgi:hypothetical protein